MQTFICPQCGHGSTYDPWAGPAHCPHCGHTPTAEARVRGERTWQQVRTHKPFLDELLAHWRGMHAPDPAFTMCTTELALAFFEDYRRALGENPHRGADSRARYIRTYRPRRHEILPFVGAYLLLKRGERDAAAQHLRDLTACSPDFVDAWVWLTSTTDDPVERVEYLENAVAREPAHPLARDALAIARERVSVARGADEQGLRQAVALVQCPQCGGALHYEPGTVAVTCPYCGHSLELREANVLDVEGRLVGDVELQRRYQGRTWDEVERVVRCQSCGAELTMTRHLARQCAFCGSTTVLTEDNHCTFEQPDGFVPFQTDKPAAVTAIQEAQHSGLRGLQTWLTGNKQRPVDLQPVYLPFWAFDGFVEVRTWTIERFRPAGSTDRVAPIPDLMMFDNLLFSGVLAPPPSFLRRVFPFELDTMVPYEPRLLADWPAVLYHRDVDVVAKDACETMIGLARRRACPAVAVESSDYEHVQRTFRVTSVAYQLVLLPAWVALLQGTDTGRQRLGLVNGQTGDVAFGPALIDG